MDLIDIENKFGTHTEPKWVWICIAFIILLITLFIPSIYADATDGTGTEIIDTHYDYGNSGASAVDNPDRELVGGYIRLYNGEIRDRNTKLLFKNTRYYNFWKEYFYNPNQDNGFAPEFDYSRYCEINTDYQNFVRLPTGWFN